MNAKRILNYLRTLAVNNNREWFQEHKDEYDACRADFEHGIELAIATIAQFDTEVAHVTVKDACYRFNRDTRFSEDKSPYKNHLGAYINAKGKKSLRGGYYVHLEPGKCLLAVGGYWLPTNILTACRNEIMARIGEWRQCVESPEFIRLFGRPNESSWDESGANGFGLSGLKTVPKGFPKDYAHVEYLRMKDYCCWHHVPDDFFEGDGWLHTMSEVFKVGKPAMDFMNSVIDDYE